MRHARREGGVVKRLTDKAIGVALGVTAGVIAGVVVGAAVVNWLNGPSAR